MSARRDNLKALPARIDPIRAGLLCRCPRCGQGRLYDGFLRPVERCAACGFAVRGLNTGDGPAVFIMQIAGGVTVFSALVVEFRFGPPLWLQLAVWPTLLAALALALMRPMKGMMIGLHYRHRAEGNAEGVEGEGAA